MGPPLHQPVARLPAAIARLPVSRPAAIPGRVEMERVRLPPQAVEQVGAPAPGAEPDLVVAQQAQAALLQKMILAQLQVDALAFAQQGRAKAAQVPGRMPLAEAVAIGGAQWRPG